MIKFDWNNLNSIVTVENNGYLNSFFELIYEANSEFLHPNLADLALQKSDLQVYLFLIIDVLFMILLEIYSKNFKCGVNARFQMKYDVQEILRKVESLLSQQEFNILN